MVDDVTLTCNICTYYLITPAPPCRVERRINARARVCVCVVRVLLST